MIQTHNLIKLYGHNIAKSLELVSSGATRLDILAATGDILAIDHVNLRVRPGSIHTLMGLSGSGKSTLLRHLNGLVKPDSGSTIIEHVDTVCFDQQQWRDIRRSKISMVFQHFSLMPHMTVFDNLALPFVLKRHKIDRDQIFTWLARIGLADYASKFPKELSGGMKQRVGLARAMIADTEIILMDEPFSSLDPLTRFDMQEMLLHLQSDIAKTVVFITHDIDEAFFISDQISIMQHGKIVQEGTPMDIMQNPRDDYVSRFLTRNQNRLARLQVQAAG